MSKHNIENDFKTGYTFDDVLLIPQRSSISSRKDTNLQSNLTKNIKLNITAVYDIKQVKNILKNIPSNCKIILSQFLKSVLFVKRRILSWNKIDKSYWW